MRHFVGSSLSMLLAGVVLSGCGGPEEGGAVPTGEQPETLTEQAAALTSPTASVSCSRSSSLYISCTGSVSGGTAPYSPQWQQRIVYMGKTYPQPWSSGGFTRSFECDEPYPGGETLLLSVWFKVTDANGVVSNTAAHSAIECAAF